MPLKSTLPKERQVWFIGKETAGGIWWPPSEITISCFPLKTIYYCQGCHKNYSPFLFQSSPVPSQFSQSLSFIRSGFSSHQQRSHNSVLFVMAFLQHFTALGRHFVAARSCFYQALWASRCAAPSTPCSAPSSASTSGCHTPGNGENPKYSGHVNQI